MRKENCLEILETKVKVQIARIGEDTSPHPPGFTHQECHQLWSFNVKEFCGHPGETPSDNKETWLNHTELLLKDKKQNAVLEYERHGI